MTKKNLSPVSTRALIQRINRKLNPDGEQVRKIRSRWKDGDAEYHVINLNGNFVANADVDLESLGRELGVLKEWEEHKPE